MYAYTLNRLFPQFVRIDFIWLQTTQHTVWNNNFKSLKDSPRRQLMMLIKITEHFFFICLFISDKVLFMVIRISIWMREMKTRFKQKANLKLFWGLFGINVMNANFYLWMISHD